MPKILYISIASLLCITLIKFKYIFYRPLAMTDILLAAIQLFAIIMAGKRNYYVAMCTGSIALVASLLFESWLFVVFDLLVLVPILMSKSYFMQMTGYSKQVDEGLCVGCGAMLDLSDRRCGSCGMSRLATVSVARRGASLERSNDYRNVVLAIGIAVSAVLALFIPTLVSKRLPHWVGFDLSHPLVYPVLYCSYFLPIVSILLYFVLLFSRPKDSLLPAFLIPVLFLTIPMNMFSFMIAHNRLSDKIFS